MSRNPNAIRNRRKTSRRVRKVVGRLSALEMYTTEGVMRFGGLGEDSLAEARQSGMVKPYPRGRRDYYDGAELIAWLKSGTRK